MARPWQWYRALQAVRRFWRVDKGIMPTRGQMRLWVALQVQYKTCAAVVAHNHRWVMMARELMADNRNI